MALRALALLQPERFPAPGSAPGSCHWHKPFITIMMTFHLFRNDFSFIQDISLPVPTASSTSDTFQSSAGYKSFGLIFFFFLKSSPNIKLFLSPLRGQGASQAPPEPYPSRVTVTQGGAEPGRGTPGKRSGMLGTHLPAAYTSAVSNRLTPLS